MTAPLTPLSAARLDYLDTRSQAFADTDHVEFADFFPQLTHGELRYLIATARQHAATRETARLALRAFYNIWGDPEDCEDCGDLQSRPCQIHASMGTDPLFRAVDALEDALGPCQCGHTRVEHNDCDSRSCLKCKCENFTVPTSDRLETP